jgi:putative transposase
VTVQDGDRESEESWTELLPDLKKRGMRTPVLAVVNGASRFWGRPPSDHPFLIKVIA